MYESHYVVSNLDIQWDLMPIGILLSFISIILIEKQQYTVEFVLRTVCTFGNNLIDSRSFQSPTLFTSVSVVCG